MKTSVNGCAVDPRSKWELWECARVAAVLLIPFLLAYVAIHFANKWWDEEYGDVLADVGSARNRNDRHGPDDR